MAYQIFIMVRRVISLRAKKSIFFHLLHLLYYISSTPVFCGEYSRYQLQLNQRLTLSCWAFWMVVICCATTDSTSTSIRLNSSKQAQAPELQSGRRTTTKKTKKRKKNMKCDWLVKFHTSVKLTAAHLASPLRNLPIAMKSSWSEQLKTTVWMARAFPKSLVVSVFPVPAGPAGAPPNFRWRAPVRVK